MQERGPTSHLPKSPEGINNQDEVLVIAIKKVGELDSIKGSKDINIVHLTSSQLTSTPSLTKLRKIFPSLTIVRITPYIAQNIPKRAKEFLENENIKVQQAYLNESLYLKAISEDIQFINNPDKIDKIDEPKKITKLHLTDQQAITVSAVNSFIDAFPNLATVQLNPSMSDKLSHTAQKILASAGIQTEIGRLDTGVDYDSSLAVNIEEKRQVFNDMLTNPDKSDERRTYSLLREFNFRAVEMLTMYLDENNLNLPEIARRLELSYPFVYTEVSALLHLIGYPSNSPHALARSKEFLSQLKSMAESEAWQKHYQVGEKSPPETLLKSRWPKWQQIMKARQDQPERWMKLKEKKPKNYEAVVYYYQIDEGRGIKVTLANIANFENVRRQAISKRIKTAIRFLTEP